MTFKITFSIEADTESQLEQDMATMRNFLNKGQSGADVEVLITGLGTLQTTKIPAIKEIRAITGLGLKEAKDIVDAIDRGEQVSIMRCPYMNGIKQLNQILSLGFKAYIRTV